MSIQVTPMPDDSCSTVVGCLPPMERSPGAAGSRLDVDDWIQAGYAIIAEDGLRALKLDRSCDRLGVTKGSSTGIFRACPATGRHSSSRGASCVTGTVLRSRS